MARVPWRTGSDADSVYVLQRVRDCGGQRFPLCRSRDQSRTGCATVRFTLTNEAGDQFYEYTSANVGHAWLWCWADG